MQKATPTGGWDGGCPRTPDQTLLDRKFMEASDLGEFVAATKEKRGDKKEMMTGANGRRAEQEGNTEENEDWKWATRTRK